MGAGIHGMARLSLTKRLLAALLLGLLLSCYALLALAQPLG